MKMCFLYLCFTLFLFDSYSQNIIPNADWEFGPAVSTDFSTGWAVDGPDDWDTTNVSPDRIYWGDLAAFRDNDSAQSGLAYVMFYGPYNEAGACTLNVPLVAGAEYHLSYYLDVDEFFDGGPGAICFNFIGCDSITTPFVDNVGYWQYFDTTFIAAAACTQLELIGYGENLTKIDNIQLTHTKASAVPLPQQDNIEAIIFPNPFVYSAILSLQNIARQNGQKFDFTMYNIFGEEVNRIEGIKNMQVIARDNLESGIYFYRISEDNIMFCSGKITIQ